jgi:hypothetical protein
VGRPDGLDRQRHSDRWALRPSASRRRALIDDFKPQGRSTGVRPTTSSCRRRRRHDKLAKPLSATQMGLLRQSRGAER